MARGGARGVVARPLSDRVLGAPRHGPERHYVDVACGQTSAEPIGAGGSVTRATVGRLAVLVAVASLATTAWAAAPSGAADTSGRPPCPVGVTSRLLSPVAPRTVVVRVRSANARRGPGTDCARLLSLPRGTRLTATGARARVGTSLWIRVTGRFGVGWTAATLVG